MATIEGKWDIDSQGQKIVWEVKKAGDEWEAWSTAMGSTIKFDIFKVEGNAIKTGLSMMGMNIVMVGTYDPATDTLSGNSNSSMGTTPFTGKRMA